MPHVPGVLRIERCDGHPNPTLALHGELDINSGPALEAALRAAEREAGERLIVDLGGLTFIDSAGIHRLLESDRRLRSKGRRIWLRPGPAQVQRLLELTGALNRLETEPSGTR
jgi:anti-anti-sigma factor